MKGNVLLVLSAFLISIYVNVSQARLVQILHTNDTHSSLVHAIHNDQRGGAERLKTLIDSYKNKMASEGVKTIVLDAGDFLEGTIFYMAEKARTTFNVHNEMGYDVGVLGNHDYLMGTDELDKLLGEIDLKFQFICANIEPAKDHPNLVKKIKPYAELEVDGIKIGIIGLTTDEVFYKWRFERGLITDPFESAQKYEKILKERGNDFIIALTHIGVVNDLRMVARTRNIDLVVGGHSHDALFKEKYGKNRSGREVPVVQAGAHTKYLGRLIVDIEKGKPLKVIKYELLPVDIQADDAGIKNLVDQAESQIDLLYGKDWLDKPIGQSSLEPNDEHGVKKWAVYIGAAIRERSGADMAIHAPPMNGDNYPVGAITRRSLFNSFPRILDINETYGWNIYTSKVRGVWLRLTIEALSLFGQPLVISGVTIEYIRTPIGIKIRKMRVDGKKVNPFKIYTVAFTEGVVKGAQGVDERTFEILRHPQDTKIKIWKTLEEKLGKEQVFTDLSKYKVPFAFLP
jgi:2',3'-cyclic-nucleotide 2'-phosphodiesterase (5'-nucleotidase family)